MFSYASLPNKRDRFIILCGLLIITSLSWLYMIYMANLGEHSGWHDKLFMSHHSGWGGIDLLLLFVMWTIMMIGMMIPSASPAILTFATTNQRYRERQGQFIPTSFFVLGYLAVWTGFSALATLGQWGLHSTLLISSAMESTSPALSGGLLLAAGVFQWTPLKNACLVHCRTPLSFLMTQWREGKFGAFVMGLKHGAYCVGCCWLLMALLFVTGVMNLLWGIALTLFVLLEKVAPAGDRFGRIAGLVFIVTGVGIIGEWWRNF